MNAYKVRVLDAKYDEGDGMLVINAIFEHNGERKIVVFSKDDISQVLFQKANIGDKNMHYFAECMSKRTTPFSLAIEDDPKRKVLNDEEMMRYGTMFNQRIREEMDQVCNGLADEQGQVQRKLGRLMDSNKIDVMGLIKEEQIVRGKLRG